MKIYCGRLLNNNNLFEVGQEKVAIPNVNVRNISVRNKTKKNKNLFIDIKT